MTVTINPNALGGQLMAIASKSQAHRILICAALADNETNLSCRTFSEDIFATASCLEAIGAKVVRKEYGFTITPITVKKKDLHTLSCGESGSTYRFLVPLVSAMGLRAKFSLSGRLPSRPMDGLFSVLKAHGASIKCKANGYTEISGQISPGKYEISGGVSSQYISGLLMALPCLDKDSEITISGETSSTGYIHMTLEALRNFSVKVNQNGNSFHVPGGRSYCTPGKIAIEGDWSNSAFWLCAAAATGKGITLTGLHENSTQGDRAVCDILKRFGAQVLFEKESVTVKPCKLRGITVDVGDIPDLVPALAIAAAAAEGDTVFTNAGRLRFKESDRLKSVCDTLNLLGGDACHDEDTIFIKGGHLQGGSVDSQGDHRIVMLAASAAVLCENSVTITCAEAVNKSYPDFFKDYSALGGIVKEQSI